MVQNVRSLLTATQMNNSKGDVQKISQKLHQNIMRFILLSILIVYLYITLVNFILITSCTNASVKKKECDDKNKQSLVFLTT